MDATWFWALLAGVMAYALGSVSFAVLVSKVMGLNDPRTYGSKNPGATNVLRSGSKAAAITTLLLDAAKGGVPLVLIRMYGAPWGLESEALALVALGAFLGHLFPLYFRFHGGKGVATALGVLLGLDGVLGLATLATWLIVAFFLRYSSLAALVAALFAPIYYLLGDGIAWRADMPVFTALCVMSMLLIARHRANISRLINGTESRIGQK
ncbi:MAG: glycerol-3-phosphate 1-O-acyltransferase PlsY [Betaproteobacteria bacterium]|nr:glycerol-3-phosphate 1-O-acyltransferase PlsY [Betaproteobacteria bacterium]NBY71968.1 glycerol-3-phosphate 1-O-acyltransferase PlsY [Betaproteobacteria bacterium]